MSIQRQTASLRVATAEGASCWCGRTETADFGEHYLECVDCGTLRRRRLPTEGELELDSEDGFYGRDYWFDHQEQRGQPDLVERSRSDLVDRAPRWLRAVLRYASPTGRCLEVGCGHGGLTFLLEQAGFDARGLDLSQSAASFARESFGIQADGGLLEAQGFDGGSFDVVVAIDVIEHLRDPEAFLSQAAELVADDGILVLQTPQRPDYLPPAAASPDLLDYETLAVGDDPFLTMLIEEHLFLFPRQALEQLLGQLGFVEVAWQEPPFAYDMLAIASRRPLRLRSDAEIKDQLLGSAQQRLVLSLLDFDAALVARTQTLGRAEAAEAAASSRLDQVRRLVRRLRRGEVQASERALMAERANEQAQAQVGRLATLLDGLRHSGLFRFLVRIGRWRRADEEIRNALAPVVEPPPPNVELRVKVEAAVSKSTDGAIAIDLSAILPGAANGGAKLTSLQLVRDLIRLAPDDNFLLLTSALAHDELAQFDGPRVERRLLTSEPTALMELYETEPVALMICPMGGARWIDPRVPMLTVVHDLQHVAYPEFFADVDRAARQRSLESAARWSDRIVTVSEFVRHTVLDHVELAPERVVSILHGVRDRLPLMTDAEVDQVCAQTGLRRGQYLLYPANCWPHKNHPALLTAFARLRHRRPDERLHLVLTGADLPDPVGVRDQAERMGLTEDVLWLGYLPDETFAGILQGCRALIFPSLYEGFGLPIVEAMAAGKPVLCSESPVLREVAGDTAVFFDPRKPHEVCSAIEQLLDDPELETRLIAAGQERVDAMDTSETCSRRYLEQALRVRDEAELIREGVAGLWEDGWTQHRVLVGRVDGEDHGAQMNGAQMNGVQMNSVEMTFANSRDDAVEVRVEEHHVTVPPRHLFHLSCRMPAGPRLLEIRIEPTFSPQQRGQSEDYRQLGMELIDYRLVAVEDPEAVEDPVAVEDSLVAEGTGRDGMESKGG